MSNVRNIAVFITFVVLERCMTGGRILGLMLMSASLIASVAHAKATGWKISEASAGVTITRDGQARPGSRGTNLETGDAVSTGKSARAVIVNGEQYAVIAPNSRLEISQPSAGGSFVQFFERLGNVVFSVKKKTKPHFGVKTPYLAAVVKGTTFSVTVDASGASVQVVEGVVEVSTLDGGARDLVLPGNIASVGGSDLGQLTVRGTETKIIKSPSVPTATFSEAGQTENEAASMEDEGRAASVSVDTEISEQGGAVVSTSTTTGATSLVINFAVVEAPKSLEAITDGMVSGSTGTEIAIASSGVTPADRGNAEEQVSGNGGGDGNGNGGGNGNGNGGGNGNGNGGGPGNGSGGGN
ncbi:MAG: hypothetical protein C0429_08585 [Sphingopyxis sp.]|nr:hypothetical protein [Sphingopyxis sp.]